MDSNKIATIYRLYGEACNLKQRFEDITFKLRNNYTPGEEDKEIFYHLRKIVDTCDNISSEIEGIFGADVPIEIK